MCVVCGVRCPVGEPDAFLKARFRVGMHEEARRRQQQKLGRKSHVVPFFRKCMWGHSVHTSTVFVRERCGHTYTHVLLRECTGGGVMRWYMTMLYDDVQWHCMMLVRDA